MVLVVLVRIPTSYASSSETQDMVNSINIQLDSVDDPKAMHKKSIQLGSLELKKYGYEDSAEFSINHDGHILGFKSKV